MALHGMWPETVTQPWQHQQDALDFLLPCLERNGGAGLFMDMGTGKSNVVLATIAKLQPRFVLIVCPKSMMSTWPRTFADHYHGPIDVRTLNGSMVKRAEGLHTAATDGLVRMMEGESRPIVLITNYEGLVYEKFANGLVRFNFDLIVLDESHKIKAPGGKASMLCKQLGEKARWRLALTGTPAHHSPLDVYAQYRFIDRSIFGYSFARFRNRYEITKTGHNGKYQEHVAWTNLDDLSDRMYQIAFRVDNSVLNLPEKIDQEHYITLSPSARTAYNRFRKELVYEVQKGTVTASNALVKLLRLQQMTGGFLPLENDEGDTVTEELGTDKYDALVDLLDGMPQSEPVVVFARFIADIDNIKKAAKETGRASFELSGRRNEMDAWRQAPGGAVIAVQIRAGSAGIDLTKARHAIFYSTGFSLGDFNQAVARVYRPGQTRTTYIHHLICENTVDEQVRQAIVANEDITRYVVDQMKGGA